jgi:hypothetical protein
VDSSAVVPVVVPVVPVVVVVAVEVPVAVPLPVGESSVVMPPGVTLLPSDVTVGCSPSPGVFDVVVEVDVFVGVTVGVGVAVGVGVDACCSEDFGGVSSILARDWDSGAGSGTIANLARLL